MFIVILCLHSLISTTATLTEKAVTEDVPNK